jgi:hypothetical protein
MCKLHICLNLLHLLFCNSSNSLFLVPGEEEEELYFFPSLESGAVVVASLQPQAL